MKKQAILFRSYNQESEIFSGHLLKMFEEVSDRFDIFILYDATDKKPCIMPTAYNFTLDDYKKSGYTLCTDEQYAQLAPNSLTVPKNSRPIYYNCEYSILLWWLSDPEYRNYEHVWSIEDDCYFFGNWNTFFDAFETCNYDMLGTLIQVYKNKPSSFFPAFYDTYSWDIPDECKVGFFGPIHRYSQNLLEAADKALKQGFHSFYELTMPTLAALYGMSYTDLYFPAKEFTGKEIYRPDSSMMGEPCEHWNDPIWIDEYRDKLLHPVKSIIKGINDNG